MKKRKLFIALLASLCVTASAAGIAACSGGGDAPTYDPALYAAYQSYADSTQNPKSYEEWVADILAQLTSGGTQGPQGEQGSEGPEGIAGENGIDGIDGESIKSINNWTHPKTGKEYLEFEFTNGRIVRLPKDGEGEAITSTGFIIKAVDNSGNPVADAYFNIGYYVASEYNARYLKADGTSVSQGNVGSAYAVRTNSKGIGTFYTFPADESITDYRAYLADPYSINSDEGNRGGAPKGYRANFGSDSNGWQLNYAALTKDDSGNYNATVKFRINNSWEEFYDADNDLHYKRYVNLENPDEIIEEHTPYVKSAIKGKYNYFSLFPYRYDRNGSDFIDDLNVKAALGVYRVSWEASYPGARVDLNWYNAPGGYYSQSNSDGSPSDYLVNQHSGNLPTDESVLQERYSQYRRFDSSLSYSAWLEEYSKTFSGGNYVDVNIIEDYVGINCCLAFISNVSCDVTITVERIGDVPEWSNKQEEVAMPSNQPKEADDPGRMLDVPFNSVIVKDDNGFYHIDSVTGPYVYVQLKNPTRANEMVSMEYLADYTAGENEHLTQFNYYKEEFDEATNKGVRTYTNYTKVVLGYAALANSDGLYRVNDLLKTILEEFCKGYLSWAQYDQYWLAACYYYGPMPDGTVNAPYEISAGAPGGRNTITLNNGSAYVYFNASTTGYYGFAANNGTISGIEGGILIDNVVAPGDDVASDIIYVEIAARTDLIFKVSGEGATVDVDVRVFDANHIVKYTVSEDGDTISGTAENPLKANTGILRVDVDLDNYSDDIYFDLNAYLGFNGNYVITVYGSDTATVVDENGESVIGKTLALAYSSASYVRLRVNDIQSGTFFIKVQQVI